MEKGLRRRRDSQTEKGLLDTDREGTHRRKRDSQTEKGLTDGEGTHRRGRDLQTEAGLADIERTHRRIAPETEMTPRRREGLAYGDSETET